MSSSPQAIRTGRGSQFSESAIPPAITAIAYTASFARWRRIVPSAWYLCPGRRLLLRRDDPDAIWKARLDTLAGCREATPRAPSKGR
jgi:hypothetical protein